MSLGLLMLRREYLTRAVGGKRLSEADFPTELGRRLYGAICQGEETGGFALGMLSETFTQDEVSRATRMLMERQKLTDNGTDVFDETVKALRDENERNGKTADDVVDIIQKKRDALKGNAESASRSDT